ncbi:unnamed protein product [Protopolystoma xenopodis]|uniref:Uncharacterized protein n=1 Tax=Protopolystoma xenopodis TaxID=117903 RepID=A0A3S5ADP1_9PLAT|nr:unnamed protein product [Protopolystoma xenopodis]
MPAGLGQIQTAVTQSRPPTSLKLASTEFLQTSRSRLSLTSLGQPKDSCNRQFINDVCELPSNGKDSQSGTSSGLPLDFRPDYNRLACGQKEKIRARPILNKFKADGTDRMQKSNQPQYRHESEGDELVNEDTLDEGGEEDDEVVSTAFRLFARHIGGSLKRQYRALHAGAPPTQDWLAKQLLTRWEGLRSEDRAHWCFQARNAALVAGGTTSRPAAT